MTGLACFVQTPHGTIFTIGVPRQRNTMLNVSYTRAGLQEEASGVLVRNEASALPLRIHHQHHRSPPLSIAY